MFPDRQLLGEDVIGSEDEPGTFYSSHRILSTMTHQGDGFFGPPTGKEVYTRIIADCICRENKVIDEWMVRDQSAIVKQIGLDPKDFSLKLAQDLKKSGQPLLAADDLVNRWTGPPDSGEASGIVEKLITTYTSVWENSELRLLEQSHDRACEVHAPGAKTLHGRKQLTDFLTGYQASFPKGKFRTHHWILNEEEGKNTRIALRWSYSASHQGEGFFGQPKGAPVVVMAMTHAELQEDLVVREYHAIDDLSLWMQIHSHSMT
jgi:predicted ester cyclase